jgi:hypothetical protein
VARIVTKLQHNGILEWPLTASQDFVYNAGQAGAEPQAAAGWPMERNGNTMNGLEAIGRLLLIMGGVLALIGGLVWLLARVGFLGQLPGDIRIERPGFTCLIPLASSIILSILLTFIINIIVRILNR